MHFRRPAQRRPHTATRASAGPLDAFPDGDANDAGDILPVDHDALPLELGAQAAVEIGALLFQRRAASCGGGGRRRRLLCRRFFRRPSPPSPPPSRDSISSPNRCRTVARSGSGSSGADSASSLAPRRIRASSFLRSRISLSSSGETWAVACACAHASSSTSMALSGRARSGTKRSVSTIAALSASSTMATA